MARMNSNIPALGYAQDHAAHAQGVLSLAQNIDQRREQRKFQEMMQKHGAALVGQDPQAQQQALGAMAQAGAAGPALALQEQQAGVQKTQAEAMAKRQDAEAKMMGFLASAGYNAKTPEEWEEAKAIGARIGIPQQMLDSLTFERKDELVNATLGADKLLEDERALKNFAEGKRRFDLEFGEKRRMNDARIASGQVGNGTNVTIMNNGNTPLDRKGRNEVQSNIIGGEAQLATFENVRSLYKPEYTSVPKKLWNQFRNWGDRMGINDLLGMGLTEEEVEFAQGYKAFQMSVQGAFNTYRKEITGAAAAMAELAMLEQAFLNQNLSQHEFPIALDTLERNTEIAIGVNKRLMEMGIERGTPEYEQAFMAEFDAKKEPMTRFLAGSSGSEPSNSSGPGGSGNQPPRTQPMQDTGGPGRMRGQVQRTQQQPTAEQEARWQQILSEAGGDTDRALDRAEAEGLF